MVAFGKVCIQNGISLSWESRTCHKSLGCTETLIAEHTEKWKKQIFVCGAFSLEYKCFNLAIKNECFINQLICKGFGLLWVALDGIDGAVILYVDVLATFIRTVLVGVGF